MKRHVGWQVGGAEDGDAVHDDGLVGLRSLAVAPALRGQIDDHAARPHPPHHVGRDEHRRLLAGDECGADDDVRVGHHLAEQVTLLGVELLAHRLGIATGRLAAARLEGKFHELRSQALHLLLHRRPDVVATHLCTQSLRGGDRLKAGHPRAEHEHLGGRERAGGGRHHRQDPRQRRGSHNHGTVAGDVGLTGEHIHALGPGDPGDEFEGEEGCPAVSRFPAGVRG